jgi:hypothetical protein
MNPSTSLRYFRPRILIGVAALLIGALLMYGCGERTLPPPPPPGQGTVIITGGAV